MAPETFSDPAEPPSGGARALTVVAPVPRVTHEVIPRLSATRETCP
jgi:hypothetical protein